MSGEKDYLRALRAAEMAAWEAGFPVTDAMFYMEQPEENISMSFSR
jgi:hypothetical protein